MSLSFCDVRYWAHLRGPSLSLSCIPPSRAIGTPNELDPPDGPPHPADRHISSGYRANLLIRILNRKDICNQASITCARRIKKGGRTSTSQTKVYLFKSVWNFWEFHRDYGDIIRSTGFVRFCHKCFRNQLRDVHLTHNL